MNTDMNGPMTGGYNSSPKREGEKVLRSTGPWSTNVESLLLYLAARGFQQAPKFLGREAEEEVLSYVPGEAGNYPLTRAMRSDRALESVAKTMRKLHQASQGFVAPEPENWQNRLVKPVEIDCIGHNDMGPYNTVFAGDEVVAFIDWDFAGPSNRLWDLAYAAHRFVPLSAPRSARAFGWADEPNRGHRLQLMLQAYGESDVSASDILDVLLVRLAALSANIETRARRGDGRFARQHQERHADGYREDIAYIVSNFTAWTTA